MACGLAVIGSNSGEIPKLIESTQGGLIFEEGRPELLRRRMEELLGDPELLRTFKQKGFTSVQRLYSHEAVARQWAQDLALIWKNRT